VTHGGASPLAHWAQFGENHRQTVFTQPERSRFTRRLLGWIFLLNNIITFHAKNESFFETNRNRIENGTTEQIKQNKQASRQHKHNFFSKCKQRSSGHCVHKHRLKSRRNRNKRTNNSSFSRASHSTYPLFSPFYAIFERFLNLGK
jgi:hypothetical protein